LASPAHAQTLTVLYAFTGSPDGNSPFGGVVRDAAGNFYGTTELGGAYGRGTVFKVNSSGTETVLHSFGRGTDGAYPFAGVVRDAAGNLYGTTEFGGAYGLGTVFKVSSEGKEKVIATFSDGGYTGVNGCYPTGGLLLDKAGYLYGTTSGCGSGYDILGEVFEMDRQGNHFQLLHSFHGPPHDGASPNYTSLQIDKNGNLYGVTDQGGAVGAGVVYELSASGSYTVLHSFAGGKTDGCYPYGTPALDGKGTVYGTTEQCGSHGQGIVWKLSSNGTETVLHDFDYFGHGRSGDGAYPLAGVIRDEKGNLYGTTCAGGSARSSGSLYMLTPTGVETVLHDFIVEEGGWCPKAGVIRDSNGNLYGTTPEIDHVDSAYGTVWEYTP
jgi:uncharacterized repeat protein (TIGR03803 family)